MEDLRTAGERLSKYELEKRHAIQLEDYERAKLKKAQMDEYRRTVYQFLEVDDLLEINGVRSNEAFSKTWHRKKLERGTVVILNFLCITLKMSTFHSSCSYAF
jgi:hypothetical protein